MEKYYKFAGVEVAVSLPDEWAYGYDEGMERFCVESVEDPHHFRVEIVKEIERPSEKEFISFPAYSIYQNGNEYIKYLGPAALGWDKIYTKAVYHEKDHLIQFREDTYKKNKGSRDILSAMWMEHFLLEDDTLILHASFIEWNGKAILFTAPSGTGKSTQAELWKEYRNARIINGDRAAIRISDSSVHAAGLPFAGSSSYCENQTLPLCAIVYLEQAPETNIVPFGGKLAFQKILEGCTINSWNKRDVIKIMDLVQKCMSQVSVYKLSCRPDLSAVQALEEELCKRD